MRSPCAARVATWRMDPPEPKRPRTEEPELTSRQCKEILKALQRHRYAHVFMQPVDPIALGIPDYFDKITHPMDFGTIGSKIGGGAYKSSAEFVADVRLVFDNARTYNPPGTDVHVMANDVEEDFDRRLRAQAAKAAAVPPAPPVAPPPPPVASAPPPPLEPVAPSAPLGLLEPEVEVEVPVPTLTSRQHSQLLRALMRTEEAMAVFNVPVDPEKHGVPDYFSVILHPMDFSARARARTHAPLARWWPQPLCLGDARAHACRGLDGRLAGPCPPARARGRPRTPRLTPRLRVAHGASLSVVRLRLRLRVRVRVRAARAARRVPFVRRHDREASERQHVRRHGGVRQGRAARLQQREDVQRARDDRARVGAQAREAV